MRYASLAMPLGITNRDGEKMRGFSNAKPCSNRVASPAFTPMAGVPTSAIAIPRSTRWAKPIR